MTNPLTKWLNKTLVPGGTSFSKREGLFADFYEDGQLKHLGIYQNGTCEDYYALNLKHGVEEGKAELVNGSGGTSDYNIYKNGTAEQFDAWSDNSRARAIGFRDWVTTWVDALAKHAGVMLANRQQADDTKERIAAHGKRSVIKPVK